MAIPIPQFQSRVRQQANYNPGALSAEQAGAGVGRALAGLGASIGQIGERLGAEFQRQEGFDAKIKEDQFLQGMQEKITELEQNAPPDGKDHSVNVGRLWREEGEKFIPTLPPRLQPEYRVRLAQQIRVSSHHAANFQRGARLGYEGAELDRYRDAAVAGIVGKPDDHDAQVAEYERRVNGSGLPPGPKYQRIEDFKERAYNARRQGLVDANRYDEAKELERQRGEYLQERQRQQPQQRSIGPVSQQDRDLMIRTVIGEAKGEPDEGQTAVANVILNRVGSGRHGANVHDVIMKPGQFTPWSTRRKELESISPDSPEYKHAAANVDRALAGGEDPTRGATHFYAPEKVARPTWATGEGQRIGGHAFHAPEGAVTQRTAKWPAPVEAKDPSRVIAQTDQSERTRNVAGYGEQLTGTITVNGNTYRFINGGGGRGSIPFGDYQISNFRSAEERRAAGMASLGDTFDLSNVHDPLAGGTRSALRIHRAQGGGTAGCIGIVGDETTWQRFVKDMQTQGPTKLTLGTSGSPAVAQASSGGGAQYAQVPGATATDASSQVRVPVPPGRPTEGGTTTAPTLPGVGVVDRMIAQRDAQLRAQANRETADYSAFVRSGGDRDLAKEDEFVRRYGPNVGKDAQEGFDRNADYGAKVKSIATATPEEVDAISREYQERLKSPENFIANVAEAKQIDEIIKNRTKALVTDPAGYIIQHSPEVRQSAIAMGAAERAAPGQVPGLSQDYAAATLAEQQRLGVRPELQRILTPDIVTGISRQFSEKPENAAALMQELQTQWGSYWPQVHGEIAKNLPGTAIVVGTMNRPDQAHAAERLAKLAKVPLEEQEELYKGQLEGRDGLKAVVHERMNGFRSTLVNNPGAEREFKQFQNAIYRLAMDNLGQGDSVDAAARRAYEDVLGKRFTLVGTARIPTEYDSGSIMLGARIALEQLLPATDIDPPADNPALKTPEMKQQQIRSLQSGGSFWVTAADQSGLTLYQFPSRKAVTVGGRPFTVSWAQLENFGRGRVGIPGTEYEGSTVAPFAPPMEPMPAPVMPTGPRTTPMPSAPLNATPPARPLSVPPAQGLTMPEGIP